MPLRKINPIDHKVKYACLMGGMGFLGAFLANGALVWADVIESVNWAGVVGISAGMLVVSLLMRPIRISFGSKSSTQEARRINSLRVDEHRKA